MALILFGVGSVMENSKNIVLISLLLLCSLALSGQAKISPYVEVGGKMIVLDRIYGGTIGLSFEINDSKWSITTRKDFAFELFKHQMALSSGHTPMHEVSKVVKNAYFDVAYEPLRNFKTSIGLGYGNELNWEQYGVNNGRFGFYLASAALGYELGKLRFELRGDIPISKVSDFVDRNSHVSISVCYRIDASKKE